ncbi:hypothetical protein Csa_020629 [Cucumis sativus]|uniref:Uncharacterized protein n=1 Tax=Cucumis sativus TaxID=3659 RepID=A0A0A0KBP7_CUCSA|nr:hypothetical protein Csa_020629 [Cucumis sativus]
MSFVCCHGHAWSIEEMEMAASCPFLLVVRIVAKLVGRYMCCLVFDLTNLISFSFLSS